MKKLQVGEIPNFVMDFIIDEIKEIRSGEIIFTAQDGYLMNVEINSRRRIADWSDELPRISNDICENLKSRICREFKMLIYGRLVIKIQKGNIVQIERTVQQRFTGLDGEGI
ncbi:MAG: DUF2292 domain-containing protein [Selenomonadaceae bacterium]|nr:DUF2292 domain-containing protein [Selenomonadaceae bacterium]MBR1859622.1 DUF2292 domain-containing protein [Selenomonadaceae bacterium]